MLADVAGTVLQPQEEETRELVVSVDTSLSETYTVRGKPLRADLACPQPF